MNSLNIDFLHLCRIACSLPCFPSWFSYCWFSCRVGCVVALIVTWALLFMCNWGKPVATESGLVSEPSELICVCSQQELSGSTNLCMHCVNFLNRGLQEQKRKRFRLSIQVRDNLWLQFQGEKSFYPHHSILGGHLIQTSNINNSPQ